MRKHLRLVALLIPMVLVASNSYAAVKAGSACSKAGIKSVSAGKTFICVKSGKKLVWDKGVLIPVAKPSPIAPTPSSENKSESSNAQISPASSLSPNEAFCGVDPQTPAVWKDNSDYFKSIKDCQLPYRFVEVNQPSGVPTAEISPSQNLLNLDECKIQVKQGGGTIAFPEKSNSGQVAFFEKNKNPGPNTIFQIIPIYSPDAPENGRTPSDDYQPYFDFIEQWIKYNSDGGSKVEVKVPKKYLKFPKALTPFELTHETRAENFAQFDRELVAAVDSEIDFTGVTMGIVIVPAGTPDSVMIQAGIGEVFTKEGSFRATTMTPLTIRDGVRSKHGQLIHPLWWVHELHHVGIGFDDRYGNSNFYNHYTEDFSESGMGGWTLMSTSRTELSSWEKWLSGFMMDSQVRCAPINKSTTHWLSPSTYKSTNVKMLVVPISNKKVVIIESIRKAGLDFKLPPQSEGALMYVLDLNKTGHGMGMDILLTTGRKIVTEPFYMADAPAKVGEYAVIDGIKISVIESGAFGDVVKVEKV